MPQHWHRTPRILLRTRSDIVLCQQELRQRPSRHADPTSISTCRNHLYFVGVIRFANCCPSDVYLDGPWTGSIFSVIDRNPHSCPRAWSRVTAWHRSFG